MQRQRRLRERAEAELLDSRDRFEALANERAMLIHEVNHRVSNSLQLIASLLLVQSSAQQDTRSAEILLDAYKRVTAVGNVHNQIGSAVVSGERVSVRVDLGGRRIRNKKKS